MSDVHRHPVALGDTTKAYANATSSIVRFLIAENECIAKALQVTKLGEEKATTSARAEFKKKILDELLSLETIMQNLYFRFVTMHKSVIHLNGWKQRCARRPRIFSDIHTVVNHMQIWTMRYKGAPLHLPKMMKPKEVVLKAPIQSQIQNYEELP